MYVRTSVILQLPATMYSAPCMYVHTRACMHLRSNAAETLANFCHSRTSWCKATYSPIKSLPMAWFKTVLCPGLRLPYGFFFGGCSALDKKTMIAINGFTNIMFGWGGEDDNTYARSVLAAWLCSSSSQPCTRTVLGCWFWVLDHPAKS